MKKNQSKPACSGEMRQAECSGQPERRNSLLLRELENRAQRTPWPRIRGVSCKCFEKKLILCFWNTFVLSKGTWCPWSCLVSLNRAAKFTQHSVTAMESHLAPTISGLFFHLLKTFCPLKIHSILCKCCRHEENSQMGGKRYNPKVLWDHHHHGTHNCEKQKL